jgi:predicted ATPase/class 3 adenylate cyclase
VGLFAACAFRVRGVTEGTEAVAVEVAVPTGIVTFLFTDVEGSTRLWADDRDAMSASLEAHDHILRAAFESRGGYVFTTAGDSFAVAFSRASDAVAAALQAQEALAETEWPGPALKVRMGLHLGEAQERAGDYFGPVVNTTARLESAGHGGQVLLTDPVRQAAEVTVRDLGVHQLRDVAEPVQIWQLGDGDFPPLRVVNPGLTNLPAAATGLVGRSEDLRSIRKAFDTARVVTLTAGGGTGKTRLALAVGEQELPHRVDGVWFVDLTPVSDGSLVVSAVAAGLGLNLVAGDLSEQILDYVANKDLLLIVDNCEHLIDEAAEFAERFIARPGRATLLATSRERLDVDGEQVIVVPPLSVDDEGSAAVELFTRRAAELDSTFALSEEDRAVVARLCRRLDGVPLAIELAAARSSVLSPEELLAGIEDRFALLHGGRRRQRQRTLEATLDWSYNLLDSDEQALLRVLGAFVGTFDLDAVAAVAGVSRGVAVDLVDSLMAKSLVVREGTSGRARFRLFETTAAYAQQHLADAGEAITVRDRHLDHYLGLALSYPLAMSADLAARRLLGPDRANLVTGFEWAGSQQQWSTAARLLLGAFTVFHPHPIEGIELVDRCVAHLSADDHDLAMRLISNQWMLYILTSDPRGIQSNHRRLRDSPTELHQVYGLAMNGLILENAGRPTEAQALLEQAFDIQHRLLPGPDKTQAAVACEIFAGMAAALQGEPERAIGHAAMAGVHQDEQGFESEISIRRWLATAMGALMTGDPNAALAAADDDAAVASVHATGDEIRAIAYAEMGELERASIAAEAHARVAVTGRVRQQAADSLVVLAALSNAEGDTATAVRLIANLGLCRNVELQVYGRQLAAQFGVGDEYQANRNRLVSDMGDAMRRKSAEDIKTLHQEMTRRGWR